MVVFTVDGSDPRVSGVMYETPIVLRTNAKISASVKHGDNWGRVSEINVFRKIANPVFTPAGGVISGTYETITIECGDDDAEIHFTTDGTTPTTASKLYKRPFDLYVSGMVKAVAVMKNCLDSDIVEAAFNRDNVLSEGINLLNYLPQNDTSYPWTVDTTVSHDGISSVRSGTIDDDQSTMMKFSISGAGRLSFGWKASCEPDDEDGYYDYGEFRIGKTVICRIAGNTGWQQFVTNFTTTGKHALTWEYTKDAMDKVGSDCIWVDQVQWLPADDSGFTMTTVEPVKYSWLEQYGLGRDSDFETAAKAYTGKFENGRQMQVWEDYVAGTDPTNVLSRLQATIQMTEDGPEINWLPDLNEGGTKSVSDYKIWSKCDLIDKEWKFPADDDDRFFKVTVEMP